MTTKKTTATTTKKSQPSRPTSRSSKTFFRNPSFLLLSLAAALLALAVATYLAPTTDNHMLRLLHRAAAPFTTNPGTRISIARMSSSATNNPAPAPQTTDSDSFHPGGEGSSTTPLALPSPDDAASAIKLDLSTGEGVKLDHLGPMVVNTDGSLSRIANWDRMAEVERQTALKVLGRRNRARLEALRAAGEGEGKE